MKTIKLEAFRKHHDDDNPKSMGKIRQLTLKAPDGLESVIHGHEKCEKHLRYYRKVHPEFKILSDRMIDKKRITVLQPRVVEMVCRNAMR